MLQIQELIMPVRGNRTGQKKTRRSGVVVHYTANSGKGANALGHKSYVCRNGYRDSNGKMREMNGNPFTWGAAQYYVDDKNIIKYIPSDEYAPHAGANEYMDGILDKIGGSPNFVLDGIEMCINPESDFMKTIDNTAQLAAKILKEDGLGIDHLFRHYDITGKYCPGMMITPDIWNECKAEIDCDWIEYYPWEKFKALVQSYMGESVKEEEYNKSLIVTASILNMRDYPGTGNIIRQLKKDTIVKGVSKLSNGWFKVDDNGLIGYCSGDYLADPPKPKELSIQVNGKTVVFPGVKPKIVDGSTFVPIKEVLESEGFTTTWDGKKNQAFFTKTVDNKNIELMVDSKTASIYGKDIKTMLFWKYSSWVKINAKVFFELDRTMVQLKPVMEAIGYKVEWDGPNNSVIVKN